MWNSGSGGFGSVGPRASKWEFGGDRNITNDEKGSANDKEILRMDAIFITYGL